MPVTTQGASNLLVPNVYIYIQNVLQAVNPYINTALNAYVGLANWGPIDEPQLVSGPAQIFNTFGNDTVGLAPNGGGSSVAENFSLVEEMLTSLPEDGSCVAVRVDDTTSTASTIALLDAAVTPETLVTLTADYHGNLPLGNAAMNIAPAAVRCDLVSGTLSTGPIYRITIFFPGQQPEVFDNISGSATFGGTWSATSFKANAVAAINGTAPGSTGSQRWTATTGSSTSNLGPELATIENATGGTNGYTNATFASMIGAPGAAPTGMYALTKTGFFHLVLAGMNNLSYVATMSSFVEAENAALGFATVPVGTSDSAAYALRVTNAAVYTNMVLVKDYIRVYDSVQQIFTLVSPLGKAAGIIGLLPPYASPINEPWNTTQLSAGGVIATEQTLLGYPRSQDQLAAMITNGFICITNQMPLNNGAFGIFDDVTSAGSPQTSAGGQYIPVQRMTCYLSQALQQIGAQFVGDTQTIQKNDPTRAAIEAAYNNFFAQLMPPGGTQWVDEANVTCDLTNNSPTTIAQGYCFVTVLVRYLGVIRILYVTLQGGTAVQVSTNPPGNLP